MKKTLLISGLLISVVLSGCTISKPITTANGKLGHSINCSGDPRCSSGVKKKYKATPKDIAKYYEGAVYINDKGKEMPVKITLPDLGDSHF